MSSPVTSTWCAPVSSGGPSGTGVAGVGSGRRGGEVSGCSGSPNWHPATSASSITTAADRPDPDPDHIDPTLAAPGGVWRRDRAAAWLDPAWGVVGAG